MNCHSVMPGSGRVYLLNAQLQNHTSAASGYIGSSQTLKPRVNTFCISVREGRMWYEDANSSQNSAAASAAFCHPTAMANSAVNSACKP